jgi:hypothetical protein
MNEQKKVTAPKQNQDKRAQRLRNIAVSMTRKKILIGSVGVAMLTTILLIGYMNGYNQGEKIGERNNNDTASNLNNIDTPFDRISTGTVISVSRDKIVINTKGIEKQYRVTDKTTIKFGDDQKQIGDIKKDSRVTIIRTDDKSAFVASQIIMRRN